MPSPRMLSLEQPAQVPQEFGLGLAFSPGRTKGVCVSTDKVEESHSYMWLPGSEEQRTP